MNKSNIKIVMLVLYTTTFYSLHGMFAQIGKRTSSISEVMHPTPTAIQRRTPYTMPRLEGIHESLTKKAKELSVISLYFNEIVFICHLQLNHGSAAHISKTRSLRRTLIQKDASIAGVASSL